MVPLPWLILPAVPRFGNNKERGRRLRDLAPCGCNDARALPCRGGNQKAFMNANSVAIRAAHLGRTYKVTAKRHQGPEGESTPREFVALEDINLEIGSG